MIQSGTHTPGISADDFLLPPHTALRYERPAAPIQRHLTSYAVLDSDPPDPAGTAEMMLPGWAQIWIIMTDGPITVDFGKHRPDLLPATVLFGVTSQARPITANGGASVVVDVSPLGWARLFPQRADTLRDRVTPLDELLPPAFVAELAGLMHGSDRALEVKGLLDDFFLRHMATPHPDEALIGQIMDLLVEDETVDLDDAAAALGIDRGRLRRASNRYFGFPPKTLLMRTRFLRSFMAMMNKRHEPDYSLISPVYHDIPHFIRDARRFLGMTPRRFMAIDTPYLDAVLRARNLVLGAPMPSLDAASGSIRSPDRTTAPPLSPC